MTFSDSRQLSFDIPEQPFIEDTYGLMPSKIRTRYCTECKKDKPRSEFRKFISPQTGKRLTYADCKECEKTYHSQWLKKPENKKKESAWRKARYTSDPESQIIRVVNIRAKKFGAKGQLTIHEWREAKELYSNCCAYCGISSLPLQIDHLWPLSLAKKGLEISEFATNDTDNIIPACFFCNIAKSNKPFIIMLGWKYGRLQ